MEGIPPPPLSQHVPWKGTSRSAWLGGRCGQEGKGLGRYGGKKGGAAFQTTECYLSGLLGCQLGLPLPLQLLQQLSLHDALCLLDTSQHLPLDLILTLLQFLLYPLGHQLLHSPCCLLFNQLLLDLLLAAGGRGRKERKESKKSVHLSLSWQCLKVKTQM